jgi:hypothetical protein
MITIRSGGQTGVDRAALDYAIRHERDGLDYTGWCPRGGWAEDLPIPPGLLSRYPKLVETPSTETWQRTAWNARDSHLTLILLQGNSRSEGTLFTQRCAHLVFLRPCLVVQLEQDSAVETARRWLTEAVPVAGLNQIVINIAGPRESEVPEIYKVATRFLEQLQLALIVNSLFAPGSL